MNKSYIIHTLDTMLYKIGFRKYIHKNDENDYFYKTYYTSIYGTKIELRIYIDILSIDAIMVIINGRCCKHGLSKVEQRAFIIEKEENMYISEICKILDIIDDKLR